MTALRRTRVLLLAALCSACSEEDTPAACDPDAAGTICTVAGNGKNGYDGDVSRDALAAKMSLPIDALTARDGTLYILDWNNHRVRRLTRGGKLEHVAGRGELGGSLDDPAHSDFNHPTGLLLDADETHLYVAAWHNSKIRAITLATGEILDVAGDGRRNYIGDGGPALTATLDLPTSIAWSPSGELVILDQANQVIRKVDGAGVISTIAGQCVVDQSFTCSDAPATCPLPSLSGKRACGPVDSECEKPCTPRYVAGADATQLRMAQPFGQSADPGGRLAYDAAGNLTFADPTNHLIRRITPSGAVEVVAGVEPAGGEAQSGAAPDGTLALEAHLNRPTDLAFAEDGTLYFTDVYNHCVRKLATDGRVYTVAGQCGRSGFSGDGGAPTEALLKLPYGITLAGDRLYVVDTGNNRVRVVHVP